MPYHPFSIRTIKRQDSSKINMKTRGSHGPSGLDACEWRRILTQFNQTSIELCKTIAKPSYTKAIKVLPLENLTAYNKKTSVKPHRYRRGSETNKWQKNHPMYKIRR